MDRNQKHEVKIPHVKFAVPEDSQAVATVLAESFAAYKHCYTQKAYDATVPSVNEIKKRFKDGATWIAVEKGEIVGTVSVVPEDSALYVRSMAVLPKARGNKIGELLLLAVEGFALEKGFCRLTLSTTPFLHNAIRLYENFGFEKSTEKTHDLFGTPLFTMVKNLERSSVYEVEN